MRLNSSSKMSFTPAALKTKPTAIIAIIKKPISLLNSRLKPRYKPIPPTIAKAPVIERLIETSYKGFVQIHKMFPLYIQWICIWVIFFCYHVLFFYWLLLQNRLCRSVSFAWSRMSFTTCVWLISSSLIRNSFKVGATWLDSQFSVLWKE